MSAALHQYQEAAQHARKAGYPQHAALGQERRVALLRHKRRDTEALSVLSSAADLYQEWGARAKVAKLEPAQAR